MAEVAAIAAMVGSVASVATAVSGAQAAQRSGRIQMQQAQVQAAQYADQREQVAQQAGREEADRLTQLRRTLGAVEALRGARGLAGDSVGAGVIAAANTETANRDLDTITLNSEREKRMLGLAGSRALLSGQAAQTEASNRALAGYGQAVQSGATFANQGYKFLSSIT